MNVIIVVYKRMTLHVKNELKYIDFDIKNF